MEFSINAQKDFWDARFQREGEVWGNISSATAVYALALFKVHGINKLLVPGSGYGRNTKLFASAGLDVTGIDISPVVCDMAASFDTASVFHTASVLDMSFLDNDFDAIYCFNTLHLFYQKERIKFIDECGRRIKDGGLLFFTGFSEDEPSFGKNRSAEKNTYESRPGRPTHYFTDDDIRLHFRSFELLVTGIFNESEDHSQGPHEHHLRYILCRKSR